MMSLVCKNQASNKKKDEKIHGFDTQELAEIDGMNQDPLACTTFATKHPLFRQM